MSDEQPKYTTAEILASTEAHAAHWENEARYSPPDVAFHCRDYAQHLRTIAECLRMDLLERDFQMPIRDRGCTGAMLEGMTMSTMIENPEKAGEIAGRRAGQLYQSAAARGVLADVRAKLPKRIPEARIEAQCMVATDCPQTQSAGRFWLSFYDALKAHFPISEGHKPQ